MTGNDLAVVRRPTFSNADKIPARKLREALNLVEHTEGGYYRQTDKDYRLVDNPFPDHTPEDSTRSASTTIFYLLSPDNPVGHFHRNKARTMHTHHRGRGQYVIIHADKAGSGQPAQIETFTVGPNVEKGERLQWMVEGGKYKASFLLPDEEHGDQSDGLLISETVVPGFEFTDHNFMLRQTLDDLTTKEHARELAWLLHKDA